ncbi:MAG: hypothetical protein OEQ16_00040 [Gammaproteobacteria bacterium]|jgi:hypothetical protein|nr:hypothetical protein [Gammaproteobacteria bacterium]MDH3819657.1 hypothetical protein [Gammaproteobacteria bacterium]
MGNRYLIAAVVVIAASIAMAGPEKERGAFVGSGLAATMFDDGGAFTVFEQDDIDKGLGVFGSAAEQFSFAIQLDAYAYADTSLGTSYDVGFTATSISFHDIY